jgi:hypothetical protein
MSYFTARYFGFGKFSYYRMHTETVKLLDLIPVGICTYARFALSLTVLFKPEFLRRAESIQGSKWFAVRFVNSNIPAGLLRENWRRKRSRVGERSYCVLTTSTAVQTWGQQEANNLILKFARRSSMIVYSKIFCGSDPLCHIDN